MSQVSPTVNLSFLCGDSISLLPCDTLVVLLGKWTGQCCYNLVRTLNKTLFTFWSELSSGKPLFEQMLSCFIKHPIEGWI